MNVGAGARNAKLSFQRRTADDNGDRTGPWETVVTIVCKLAFLNLKRNSELVLQERLVGVQPVDIVVRSTKLTRQITNAWRVLNAENAAEVFNIRTVARGATNLDDIQIVGEVGIAGHGDG